MSERNRAPMATAFLDASSLVHRWNNALPARVTIVPCDTVVLELVNVPTTTVTGYLPEAIFDR